MSINYKAEPTASRFHRSEAFVRGLRGPLGTGKSVTCCMEMIRRAREQEPFEGVRRTRWAAIRNTYPELKTTTVKTWQDWSEAPVKWDIPITSKFVRNLSDGTTIELEVIFLSVDRPADIKKLKSLDLTGVWLNEASELAKAVLDMATGRVGRFPAKEHGGSTWSGVIMDTNSPDDDHWYYALAEQPDSEEAALQEDVRKQLVALGVMRDGQPMFEFFAQPGALIRDGNRYLPNPAAENVKHHTLGYGYWLRQLPGKSEQWINVYVLGQYGSVHDGRPVYSEWNDTLHVKSIGPLPGVPLDIGMDFGLTPAAIITQFDERRGRLLVLDEICADELGMGVRQFMQDLLVPQLVKIYPAWWAKRAGKDGRDHMIRVYGDPAGNKRAETDESTAFKEVTAAGLWIKGAQTNKFVPRRSAVAWFLSKLVSGGQPAFVLDPCCTVLRKGFNGGYKYRRIQVTGEERYTDEPVKNAFSHPHDGLQYVALEHGGVQAFKPPPPPPPRVPRFRVADSATGALG